MDMKLIDTHCANCYLLLLEWLVAVAVPYTRTIIDKHTTMFTYSYYFNCTNKMKSFINNITVTFY